MKNKSVITVAVSKFASILFVCFLISLSNACAKEKIFESDIHAEIQKYEWSELYDHKYSYEKSCEILAFLLPARLNNGFFTTSLLDKESGFPLYEYFIPAYGGKYMNGIPMKNRQSYEECYATTLEVLRPLHKEYIEMGIIQKKSK